MVLVVTLMESGVLVLVARIICVYLLLFLKPHQKSEMQRMMEVAGMGVPDDLRGKDMSSLTSEDLRRMRSHLAAKMEGEASVQRQSAPREVERDIRRYREI